MTASSAYLAHIDGLRAVAVLAVMAYHLEPAWLPGGFVGVDVFFVISGYVVTASLAGHADERAGAFLARFYARRLMRLAPALTTMLVVTTALYVLFVPRAWFNRAAETTGQAAFWGLSNWELDRQVVNYFEPRAEFNPFTHTWSLGVEEQFYLIAPLLLFVALGHRPGAVRRQHITLAIAALAGLSLAACLWTGWARGSRSVFYPLSYRFWELAAGVLLFLGGPPVAPPVARRSRLPGVTAWIGALVVALTMFMPRPEALPWLRAAVAAAGTLPLLLIGPQTLAGGDRLTRALSSRGAVWLGQRSYALYLWHWPVFVLARWTTGLDRWPLKFLATALSLAAAATCYRAVENPVRQSVALGRLPPWARITTMLTLLAAGWLAGDTLLAHQRTLGLGQATRQAADWYSDRQLLKTSLAAARVCKPAVKLAAVGAAADGLTRFDPGNCTARATARLFVVGDSHATAYLPALEQLSAEQGRRIDVVQVPGCAFLNLTAPMTRATNARCHASARDSLRLLLAEAVAGDIVFLPSLRLPRLIHLGGQRRVGPGGDSYSRTADELAGITAAAADATRWLEPLTAAGLQVILELPRPVFRAHPFACVDAFNRGNALCRDGLVEARADQERYRAPVVDALRRLAAADRGLRLWDPLPLLCDHDHCTAMHNGRPLYFDADHLSPYGNLVLLPALRALFNGSPYASP